MKGLSFIIIVLSCMQLYSMEISKDTFTDKHKSSFYRSLTKIIKKGNKYNVVQTTGIIGAAHLLKQFDFEKHIITDEKILKNLNALKTQYDQDEDKVKEVFQKLFPMINAGEHIKSFIVVNSQKTTCECITPLATLLLHYSLIE